MAAPGKNTAVLDSVTAPFTLTLTICGAAAVMGLPLWQ